MTTWRLVLYITFHIVINKLLSIVINLSLKQSNNKTILSNKFQIFFSFVFPPVSFVLHFLSFSLKKVYNGVVQSPQSYFLTLAFFLTLPSFLVLYYRYDLNAFENFDDEEGDARACKNTTSTKICWDFCCTLVNWSLSSDKVFKWVSKHWKSSIWR